MDEIDILLTVAEIGVALAGFASLAAILGQRHKHTDPVVNAVRLRGLLDAGLTTMLLALIGVLMANIGGEDYWVWRASSAFGLLAVCTIGVAAYRRDKLRSHLPGYRKRVAIVMFTFVTAAGVGYTVTLLGLAGEYGFHIFFANLCLLLAICCTMFVLVIASLMTPNKESE